MKNWFAAVLALVTLTVAGTVVLRQAVPVEAAAPQAAKTGQAALTAFDPQVSALLAQMTLDEKIGQMTQAEQSELSKDLNEVDGLFLGRFAHDPSAVETVLDELTATR